MDEGRSPAAEYQITGLFPAASSVGPDEVRKQLQPLIDRLTRYDLLRIRMEREGGEILDIVRNIRIFSEKILIRGRFNETVEAAMLDQNSLRRMMFEVGGYDYHISVRRLDSGMPAYYLCRIRRDFWSEYALIVEDLYCSPGYPVNDGRFMKLMTGGHETYHLRLAQFRNSASGILRAHNEESPGKTDLFLYNLGRNVFQSAWHEDQRPAFLVAGCLRLTHFKNAVELLYLCLSGELCELRGTLDPEMLEFFDTVYPNSFLKTFLGQLPSLEGRSLNSLPERALKAYCRLTRSFAYFLQSKVKWGNRTSHIPLYKLLYSNLSRLNRITPALHTNEALRADAVRLESEACEVASEILKNGDHHGC